MKKSEKLSTIAVKCEVFCKFFTQTKLTDIPYRVLPRGISLCNQIKSHERCWSLFDDFVRFHTTSMLNTWLPIFEIVCIQRVKVDALNAWIHNGFSWINFTLNRLNSSLSLTISNVRPLLGIVRSNDSEWLKVLNIPICKVILTYQLFSILWHQYKYTLQTFFLIS